MKNIKDWLLENGYGGILTKIRQVEDRWKQQGKKTRRNWWDVLAGRKSGEAIIIEGVRFPVLGAARLRKGLDITPRAMRHEEEQEPLPILPQARCAEQSKLQEDR